MNIRRISAVRLVIFKICVLSVFVTSSVADQAVPVKPAVNIPEITALIARAKELLEQGSLVKAREILQAAMKKAPYDPRPYAVLAEIYFKLDSTDEAFKILEQAGRVITNTDYIFEHLSRTLDAAHDRAAETGLLEIAPFKDDKSCAVSFNFDDGAKSVAKYALPIFEDFGYTATLFVNPGYVSPNPSDRVWGSWDDWREAQRRGFEIGNHTVNHVIVRGLDEPALEREINGSFDLIRQETGHPPRSFAFPSDRADAASLDKAAERHPAIREHATLTRVHPRVFIAVYGGNHFSVQTANFMVHLAVLKNAWLIPQLHGMESEEIRTYKPVSEELLREHLEYIRSNEDNIWVDSFFNVFAYLQERRSTRIEASRVTSHSVLFRLRCASDPVFYRVPLTIVIRPPQKELKHVRGRVQNRDEKVPVEIKEDKILLSVMPHEPGWIFVQWQ